MKQDLEKIVLSSKTFADVLQKRAQSHGEKLLYTFLLDGEGEEASLTYGALDAKVRAIAALLQKEKATGARALLLYPPGLDYINAFLGCLYAGLVAVPAYPPDPNRLNRTLPRLISIIKDSQAKFVLTTGPIKDMSELLFAEAPELKELHWISTDSVSPDLSTQWRDPGLHENDLAFLQYTSGSTGEPKGVMLSHRNLLENLKHIYSCFGHSLKSRAVIWLPPYHDMGLIGGILQPLYGGFPVFLMSPLDFLQKPYRWLKAISQFKGTTSGGPNFAYDLCVRKITSEQKKTLDLSHWELAFSGAEPVNPDTMRKFAKYFRECGFGENAFYPCYGLAEATLIVSGAQKLRPFVTKKIDSKTLASHQIKLSSIPGEFCELVSSGHTLKGQEILIVNPQTMAPCSSHEVGEIWVSGSSIALGYWEKPELSEKTFRAFTADQRGPFLRSGDLGFLSEEELFITGRLKDLIIIRGTNHYPQDIETTIDKGGLALRTGCGAAFAFHDEGEEKLGIVWEVSDSEDSGGKKFEEMISQMRELISRYHQIHVEGIVLIKKGTIAKTSSGKIQRHICKLAYEKGELHIVHQWKEKKALPSIVIPLGISKQENCFTPNHQEKQSKPAIQQWLIRELSTRFNLKESELDLKKPFSFYGIDSKEALSLAGDLEDWLQVKLSPTLLWQYPDIDSLVTFLSGAAYSSEKLRAPIAPRQSADPIAIVGMSCRFPGAKNPKEFWELLKNGTDAISEVPAERWNVDTYYDPQGVSPGKMNTRWGGFLEKIDKFDARFFGISPREATRMDPQQRLLLELSWEAFESAGMCPEKSAGSQTGVFIGIGSTDYLQLQYIMNFNKIDPYMGTGNAHSIAANRISYLFDFRGPSLAIDTACSSSLVALHLACKSLHSGESNLALAGGVNLILKPETTIVFSQARMMSSKGRCFTFDEAADGYVRSEGCGVVLLKRYSDALKDGDPILALIRGSAVNQDGHSNGLTAPSSQAQQAVMREALSESGVSPAEISYFEAHGTGTPLGDPIETESISAVIQSGRNPLQEKCWLASVKTNIGHLEVASGIAGLIKVILAFKHRQIPPHLHFKKINPHIPMDQMPFRIPMNLEPWEVSGQTRYAAVNSFGFGGTNANVILQEAPPQSISQTHETLSPQIFKFSAKSENALKDFAHQYTQFLEEASEIALDDFIFSANRGRSDFDHRAFGIFDSKEQLLTELRKFSSSAPSLIQKSLLTKPRKPKLTFLFTGQGSQYPGMAKKLYETEPVVRKIFDRAQNLLTPILERPLLKVLFGEALDSQLIHETAYTQPALFTLEYALAELWKSWGIEADYVMGHSVGEYVAASYAGVMSWEKGLYLVAERARLMQSLPKEGSMAVIAAPEDVVSAAIAPFLEEISIAGINGPKNVVISGKKERVEAFVKYFSHQKIATQLLNVSHAFHSPLMDPILDEFEKKAQEIVFCEPQLKLVSNLSGKIFTKGEKPDAKYYRQHLRGAVQFSKGIEALAQEGCEVFLELGPQAHLIGMARKCLSSSNVSWIGSLKKGEDEKRNLLEACGRLYLQGLLPDWKAFYQDPKPSKIALPTYPFQREKYWIDLGSLRAGNGDPALSVHPFLGEKLCSPLPLDQYLQEIDLEYFPYLKDHAISGEVIYPAAAYVEMALAAGRELWKEGPLKIKNFHMKEALFLERGRTKELSFILTPETKKEAHLKILSRSMGLGEDKAWKEHVTGILEKPGVESTSISKTVSLLEIQKKCPQKIDRLLFYDQLHEKGLEYGPAFRALNHIWVGDKEALASIRLPEEITGTSKTYFSHPSILDAAFQLVAALIAEQKDLAKALYLPSGISMLEFFRSCPTELWAHVSLVGSNLQKLKVNLELFDKEGNELLKLQELELMALASHQNGSKHIQAEKEDYFYEISWIPQVYDSPIEDSALSGTWISFHHGSAFDTKLHQMMRQKGAEIFEVKWGETYRSDPPYTWRVNPSSREDFDLLLKDFLNLKKNFKGLLYSAVLEEENKTISLTEEKECLGLLHWIQSSLQLNFELPLWILTQNTQDIEIQNTQLSGASLWGFARTLRLEHPELGCKTIDVSHDSLEVEALVQEMLSPSQEDQIVYRNSQRYVARLKKASYLEESGEVDQILNIPSTNYRLEITQAGVLGGVKLKPIEIQAPLPQEVQIEVYASALNFSDVLKVLGLYPGLSDGPTPIGIECSGKVLAVGSSVKNFKAGDEVIAVAPFAFGNRVSTREEFVVQKPKNLSFEEASTIPIAYLTAHYALNHLGRMRHGEKILIHAGAGGVGIAAIQLAKMAGLEIFATAGSPQKREYLKTLGGDHIFDSRSLDFADEIMSITRGKGVDLVLNSLAGDFIPKSISVLGAYGRFLEIGKIDIYQNSKIGLLPFQNNLSYFAIDLDRVLRERPDWIHIFLVELMGYFKQASLQALPHTDFPIVDSIQAFRYMAQRKNIGKVLITLPHSVIPQRTSLHLFAKQEGTYLITGGLGDLGLELVSWMHQKGARHFALLGRSAPSSQAEACIERLRREGSSIQVYQGDVADLKSLEKVLGAIQKDLGPLCGVIHAAGVLEDGVLLQQNAERFAKVFAAKVKGAWNLHTLTQKTSLDFFVMFSSLSSVLGSPGQGNYASANAFLDAFAHYRRALGLPALAINWGPWAEVGMAARAQAKASQSAKGIQALSIKQSLDCLEKILNHTDVSQITVLEAQWNQLALLLPKPFTQHFLSLIQGIPSEKQGGLEKFSIQSRSQIIALQGEARKTALVQLIRERVAKVLGITSVSLATEQALNTLGLDSLMAIEMKNDIESSLGVTLTMAFLLKGPSIAQLAEYLVIQMEEAQNPPSHLIAENELSPVLIQ